MGEDKREAALKGIQKKVSPSEFPVCGTIIVIIIYINLLFYCDIIIIICLHL